MTVGKLLSGRDVPISQQEFILWTYYRAKFGFDTDRIEWATANGASAMCHAWGVRTTATDIVPRFNRGGRPSHRKLLNDLASLPGAVVTFTPKDPSRPVLHGVDALAELDRENDDKRRGRTLDGPPPTKPDRNRRTLSGD